MAVGPVESVGEPAGSLRSCSGTSRDELHRLEPTHEILAPGRQWRALWRQMLVMEASADLHALDYTVWVPVKLAGMQQTNHRP